MQNLVKIWKTQQILHLVIPHKSMQSQMLVNLMNLCKSLLILANTYKSLKILINPCKSLLILTNNYKYLQIFIDLCNSFQILANPINSHLNISKSRKSTMLPTQQQLCLRLTLPRFTETSELGVKWTTIDLTRFS